MAEPVIFDDLSKKACGILLAEKMMDRSPEGRLFCGNQDDDEGEEHQGSGIRLRVVLMGRI